MSFKWDVKILNDKSELMGGYYNECIYKSLEIIIDRRHGEYDGDYKFNWHSGEIITIKGYYKDFNNVYSFGFNGNAMLTGVNIKISKEENICEDCNGRNVLNATEALDIVNKYKDRIINEFEKAFTVTKQYIYEEDTYSTYAHVSLQDIEINESEIYGEAYVGQNDYNYELDNDSYNEDPDLWDESDMKEYYGYEADYEGDYD